MIKKIGLIAFICFLVSTYAYGESVLKSSLVSTTHTPSQWSTNNRITVKWTKPDPDETYGAVRGYSYVWDTDASTNPGGSLMLDASVTELTSQPLADGQNIYFHIRVIYENGSPYEWDDLGPFWIDATPPSKPTNLNISPGDGKLTLSWDPPRDTDFDHVTIRRLEAQGSTCSYPSSPSEGAAVADVSKGTTSYVDTGLTNGKTYCYSLFAYDAHGNYSEPAQANGAPRSEAQVTYATVSSTDPSNNATDVPVTSPITISFTKDMNFGTISSSTILVKDSDGNTVTGEWSQVTSKVAKFTPSQALSYSKTYIVTILGGPSGVRDSVGNWLDGNNNGSLETDQDNYTFKFTTYVRPYVVSVEPADKSVAPESTAVTIAFSRAMKESSITSDTIVVKENDQPKTGTLTYYPVDKRVVFQPGSPFAKGAQVTVVVKGGPSGVQDENGETMETDYTFSFTIQTYYTFTLELKQGWNLISLPLEPADIAVANVLSGISGKYAIVWGFDPAAGWKKYQPGKPSDLQELMPGRGYWIKMTEAQSLSMVGNLPSKSVLLSSGWNLVGFNSRESLDVTAALAGISGKYAIVWGFDPAAGWKKYQPGKPSDLQTFEAGNGYWIKVTEQVSWTLP
jgi:hypothetical protein